jgi:hypothetical protein
MPTSTNEGKISRNSSSCMILVCLRTNSNILVFQVSAKNKKANIYLFAFAFVVGADGFEPPTYAL